MVRVIVKLSRSGNFARRCAQVCGTNMEAQ